MRFELRMPFVEKTTVSGTIIQWHVREGESVDYGDPLFDAEMTYKRFSRTKSYRVRVVSSDRGVLRRVIAAERDARNVGDAVAILTLGTDDSPEENGVGGATDFRVVANMI